MKSLLDKINAKLNAQGGFLKAVSILVGGTVFAQGITILALPILTRLYTPEEFSLFAIYTSLLMTLSVVSCLRFEIAIPIAKQKSEAIDLVVLSFISNIIISILLFVLVLFFQKYFINLTQENEFKNLIWLVPLGVFFLGIYNIFQYWATREKLFTTISKTRMVQSISGVIVQISMGLAGFAAIGLVLGQIIKVSSGSVHLITQFYKSTKELVSGISYQSLVSTFKKNQDFPRYSALEALMNSAALQLPIIFIASVVGGGEAGFLMLAMQVMAIPITFIGNAISQVYLANATRKLQDGQLKKYTLDCIFKLVKLGILPLVTISLISPFIFPIFFGAEWKRAGEMVVWMMPWFVMQLLVSPISMSLHIMAKQKIALIIQAIGLFIRLGGLIVFSFFFSSYVFEYYALSGFLFYLIYFIIVLAMINLAEKMATN